jgi:ferredoxin-NADP reductase/MOSC domain-containing protein YiiM/ferredoxin
MTATPRLLSVNVGLPRDVPWQGKTVHTGIWKDPVTGPRMVRRLNVDGDGQGDTLGHGGEHRAVFVYQIESYSYWQEQLGRDDFTYGQFGENFTIQGLTDDDVCVGDRYRIGAATFEVTQPRVTCYRVGIRMDEPDMPSLLVAHHRPGFYLRVLEEGEVQAGDEINKVAAGPQRITVADIDALLYLPSRSRRDLRRALEIPALSEGWKGSFRELLEQTDPNAQPAEKPPAWTGFRELRVTAITRESDTVTSFQLEPDGAPPPDAPLPGQFLTVRLHPHAGDAPVLRNYSLSALPDPRTYRIGVKREPHGVGSGHLHGAVQVGDVIEAAAPRGSFVLQPGTRPVVLISAGVGATPTLAMLHALAASGSTREVWWIHASRNRAEHPFADEADRLLDALGDGHRIVCYSRPRTGEEARLARARRVDGGVLDQADVPVDADYYLCGPGQFMADIAAALTARGVAPERVRCEIFGTIDSFSPGVVGAQKRAPHPPAGRAGTGPGIAFTRSNLTVPWDDECGSLLELAEACDVPVSFGCRTGVCHSCESGLLIGDVAYQPDPLEPPSTGNILMCCSRPTTDLTLDL